MNAVPGGTQRGKIGQIIMRSVGILLVVSSASLLGTLLLVSVPQAKSTLERQLDKTIIHSFGLHYLTPAVGWISVVLVLSLGALPIVITWQKRNGGLWSLVAGVAALVVTTVVAYIITTQSLMPMIEIINHTR